MLVIVPSNPAITFPGLQFHFEPEEDNVREIAVNDHSYPDDHNDLNQTATEIIEHAVNFSGISGMVLLCRYTGAHPTSL